MGSIKTDTEAVVVTFEVERLLDEPVRMLRDGKFQVSTNIKMRHVIAWVLWSLASHKIPSFDPSAFETIQLSYDPQAGTFVATMKKQC